MGSLSLPHVVIVPISAAGHCAPFLCFAKHLAAEGFTVTFVSTDKHISELLHNPGTLPLVPHELPIRFVALGDGLEHLTLLENFLNLTTQAGREKAIRLLVELITDLSSPNAQSLRGVPTAAFPACVLHDMLACWAQEAAEKLQIEKHLLYVSPTACLTIGFQSERLGREGRVPVTPETEDIPITDIPGLPPFSPLDLPSLYLNAATHEWFKYHDHRNSEADVVLVNSFYDLERQVIDAVRKEVIGAPGVQTKCLLDIGPLLPESHTSTDDDAVAESLKQLAVEEEDPCILWLNTQKPASVLYICFGSQTTHSAPQLLDLAMALEASGQPFLWILRPPGSVAVVESSDALPSMTEYLPPGYEERLKGRGMCYSGWAPQRRILGHAATGGFLTHCGWNSILESVCAGVPMLTWPFWADQNVNNRFLVDMAGLAVEFKREPLDPERDLGKNGKITRRVQKAEIERQVRRLMQEEEGQIIRQRMQKMKLSAWSALAPGGSSRRNFENYVWLLRAKHSSASDGKASRASLSNVTRSRQSEVNGNRELNGHREVEVKVGKV